MDKNFHNGIPISSKLNTLEVGKCFAIELFSHYNTCEVMYGVRVLCSAGDAAAMVGQPPTGTT